MNNNIPDFHKQMERDAKNRMRKSTRREWLKYTIFGGTGFVVLGGYSAFEAQWLELKQKEIMLAKMSPKVSLRLLHLSDLHLSSLVSLEYIKKALNMGLQQSPHACVLTGDFVTAQPDKNKLQDYASLLGKFAQKVPTYACLGNHDGGNWAVKNGGYGSNLPIRKLLESAGIKVLENQREELYLNGIPLDMVGLGDLWSGNCRPHLCLEKTKDPKTARPNPVIVLNHNPDAKEGLTEYTWDLMLSGHSHGGQFVIPYKGYAPFAPIKEKDRAEGTYNWQGRIVHITRGVGNLYGLRLNCRPEVSILKISGIQESETF